MGRLFGTDGVRGVAVTELTCELSMQIGRAAAVVLTQKRGKSAKILIGKDTRISSDILEAALIAGITSIGADAVILGVVPTPAVAYLVNERAADAGIMISASHNSFEFNGIKLFSGDGYKLSDEVEEEIESLVLDFPEKIREAVTGAEHVGRVIYDETACDDYAKHVLSAVNGDFGGLRVAIDCANGSAGATAEKIFAGRGAKILMLNSSPDGININDKCGSTHMDILRRFVVQNRCQVGLAFDGDADRCLAVDENGALVDGDKLIAIFAKDMAERDALNDRTAVVTVMTNIGFSKFASDNDINVVTTKVGDRYILERMLKDNYSVGGEQSGHIIFKEFATTGDGELTAAILLSIMKKTGKKLSELASVMERYPQVMINVRIDRKWKEAWKNIDEIGDTISGYEKKLGSSGRILVRESGTEPLIRVMLEGKDTAKINEYALAIADKIKKCCPSEG